ncbi:MAG: ribonuclease P protein component [Candidatus Aminicenantia bacterium]
MSKKRKRFKKKEILEILRKGKRVRSENIVVVGLPNEKGFIRLVINVSGKIGKAVVRNKIKRIYREIFRKNKEKFPKSYDIIIIPSKDVKNFPSEVLSAELFSVLSKLNREGLCKTS